MSAPLLSLSLSQLQCTPYIVNNGQDAWWTLAEEKAHHLHSLPDVVLYGYYNAADVLVYTQTGDTSIDAQHLLTLVHP